MTGFKLSWFIEYTNGTKVTESKPGRPDDWKSKAVEAKYQDDGLAKMVQLARQARLGNITREKLMDRVIREKVLNTSFRQSSTQCRDGQLNVNGKQKVFGEVFDLLNSGDEGAASEDDTLTGLTIYSVVVFCNQMKLEIFLDSLITTQTLQSILKTLINTIDSESVKTIVSKKMVSEFYHALKNTFNLQYDKILMATASEAHLNLPYFLPYRKGMDKCRNGTSCYQISKAINSLGKVWLIFSSFFFSHADPGTREVSFHPAHLTDSQNRLLPAALIPLCSYQGAKLGKEMKGFVACDKFQPTVLEGQMCYSLQGAGKAKAGKRNGLLLVLDSDKVAVGKKDTNLARVYLHSLSPFTDYRNGSYAMSALKKMTGTEGFLRLPYSAKKCQVETFEDCNRRKYVERVRTHCHCTLWALQDKQEVYINFNFDTYCRTPPSARLPPQVASIQFP